MSAPHAVPIGPVVGLGTSAMLAVVAGMHVLWGRGSTFPYRSQAKLNDSVIGRDATPSPRSCYTVAAMLLIAAASVGRAATGGGRLVRLGSAGVAGVLIVRAGFGLAGRTDLLVPGSDSERFRRLDRRVFAPACASLGVGAATAALVG